MSSKRNSKRNSNGSRSSSPERKRTKTVSECSILQWISVENNSVLFLPPSAELVRQRVYEDAEASVAYMKVASFDLDDTVITPATGKVFPTNDPSDWRWLHPSVPQHLRDMHDRGYLLVLFSNQSGIGKGKVFDNSKANAIREKVVRMSAALDVPLTAFVSTREDQFRKPGVAMWGLLQQHIQDSLAPSKLTVDCDKYAFYVGDAAGRSIPTLAGRKKDFSCSDRKFAYNLSIPFMTPEECFRTPITKLFQQAPVVGDVFRPSIPFPAVPFEWGDAGPEELRALPSTFEGLTVNVISTTGERTETLAAEPYFTRKDGVQDMVLMVGYPGCGKSTFCRRHLVPHGYVYVNRDTLKTKEKCLAVAAEAWKAGRNVVIDNTNPACDDRAPFTAIAKARLPVGAAVSVRIFSMQHTKGLAMHLNHMRARVGMGTRISSIVYNMFKSKHSVPHTPKEVAQEGVSEVWQIPPVVSFEGFPPNAKRDFYELS